MTIKDIANAAGVSPSTVSKVINQKDANISEETRQRVLQVIEDSNYIPYAGVRGKLLAQNNQIALILPSLKNGFYAEFADTVQRLVRKQGFSLIIQSSSGDIQTEQAILSELSDAYIAGLLLFPVAAESLSFLGGEDCNINNAVLLDCSYPHSPLPQLSRDFSATAEAGTAYLLKNNHRRIALVLRAGTPADIREKTIGGYKAALSSASAIHDDQLILYADEQLDEHFENLVDAGIDAVICQDGFTAGETYRIISRKQYKIPEDISVLCLEDSPLTEQLSPAVSAMRTDVEEMAQLATDTLITQISAGQTPAFLTSIPSQLIRRDSIRKHTKPKHKIVIAGSINMDVTLNVPRLPHSGETVLASAQSAWPGGKGANQAIGVSRFGADAFMIGRLGNDVYGKQLFERMTREQVDMRGVSFSKDQLSGTAFINVQSDGQNTIVVNPGANASLTPEYVEENRQIFSDAQYCLIQMEIPLVSIEAIIRICKEQGIRVILKPSPVQPLPAAVLDDLFMLVPNLEELEELVPGKGAPEKKARLLLEQGVKNVIVTLAEKGCIYVSGDECREYPAMEFPSIDSTGASDIFISCLAAQLSRGCELDKAIRLATIAASYSVSKEGVQNAIINPDLLADIYNGSSSLSVNPRKE